MLYSTKADIQLPETNEGLWVIGATVIAVLTVLVVAAVLATGWFAVTRLWQERRHGKPSRASADAGRP